MTATAPLAACSPAPIAVCRAGMECSGRDLDASGRPA